MGGMYEASVREGMRKYLIERDYKDRDEIEAIISSFITRASGNLRQAYNDLKSTM